jgi:hypothetical protein
MKIDHLYDHQHSVAAWKDRELYEWLRSVFEAPAIQVREGHTDEIRQHVREEFQREGWATNVKIDSDLGLSVFAMKSDLAFHLQTGNISRAAYDLLKLQYLYTARKIQAAALAVPTKECAVGLGSNLANAERITSELQLFDRIITVPILVIAFQ